MKTQCSEPRNVIGIAAAIPVMVAMFAFKVPGPSVEFIARLTEILTTIAIV